MSARVLSLGEKAANAHRRTDENGNVRRSVEFAEAIGREDPKDFSDSCTELHRRAPTQPRIARAAD